MCFPRLVKTSYVFLKPSVTFVRTYGQLPHSIKSLSLPLGAQAGGHPDQCVSLPLKTSATYQLNGKEDHTGIRYKGNS